MDRPGPNRWWWHPAVVAVAVSLGVHATILTGLQGPSARDTKPPDGTPGNLRLTLAVVRESPPTSAPPRAESPADAGGDAKLVEPAAYRVEPAPGPVVTIPSIITPSAHAGGTPTTGTQPSAGLLDSPADIRSVVYVVDRSLSMGLHGALERAIDELTVSLRRLPATARFQVLAYNSHIHPLAAASGLATASPKEIQLVARAVNRLEAAGGTDHVQALMRGLSLAPEVLFYITDADALSADGVRKVTLRNHASTHRTIIHVLELNREGGRPDNLLRRLAEANGGTYRRVAPTAPTVRGS